MRLGMVARNLHNQFNAFHNPPSLDDSHWSQTSEEGSDIPSPAVFEHANFVTNTGRYHHDESMEYRNPPYVLPPPSIHPTGNHQGLQVSDLSMPATRPSYQRHSSSTHSPSPLETSPRSKAHLPAYDRIGQTSAINPSREPNRSHPNKSFPTGQSVIKGTTPSNKSRPPRRSSANGVVACRQCRSRKIRCDSTRPGCENCSKRSTPCEYDSVPKRRGPDKRPGTRRRSCKKRPVDEGSPTFKRKKRRGESEDDESDVTDYPTKYEDQSISPIDKSGVLPTVSSLTINTEVPRVGLVNGLSSAEPDSRSSLSSVHRSPVNHISQGPSLEYHRRTWWDNLLDTYSSTRAQSVKHIMSDLSFLFSTHTFWLPFINAPIFLQKLSDPMERMRMQPSLVIAALALATMIKSSNIELGDSGRERARNLGNAANAELQAALNTGALDHTLAEAALILTVYEFCPHPTHSLQRATNHLVFLDNLIRAQSLSFIDSQERDVSTFAANLAPIVRFPTMYVPPEKCSCPPSSFPYANDALQSKVALPPWDPSWSSTEAHREECRRLCWSALSLAASQSVIYSAFDKQPLDLFLSSPSNFSIFFPGESAAKAQILHQQSPKESVWALFCRTLLLWCSCIRQKDEHRDNAEFAIDAWQETQAIQDALDTHICTDNSTLVFLCREYLHNSRMSITKEFRRLQGVDNGIRNMFNIKHARDWLYHSDQVAKRIRSVISEQDKPLGYALARNPLEISWFATQVSICLRLWNFDRSLIEALEVAKSYLLSVDILNALFPCHASSLTRDELHQELEDACIFSGLQPPTRAEYSLPHPQSHHNYVQPTI